VHPSGDRRLPEGTYHKLGHHEREAETAGLLGLEDEMSYMAVTPMEEPPPPRDVDFEHANSTLRHMRAPGCSEITAVQTYNCLDQLGLTKNIDVPRQAMRAAAAAASAAAVREAREAAAAAAAVKRAHASLTAKDALGAEDSKLTTGKGIGIKKGGVDGGKDDATEGARLHSGGKRRSVMDSFRPLSPVKLAPPKGLLYRAPIESLQRSAGLRKQLAHEIIRFSVDPEELTALNDRVKEYHREKADNMDTDFCALHRMAVDGYDARAAAMATEQRRDERDRRGELVRARRAEVLHRMATRETRAQANERRKIAAAELARRQSQQRKLMALVALHTRLKHAWQEVLIIRTVHKIHINQARASRVVQKHWRGYTARSRFQRTQRALQILQPRMKLWYHRKKLRDGARVLREFLENIAAGNEVIRRLHALRKSCATIQSAFRSAFRSVQDQVDVFIRHWNCYEQYIHMVRAETARRKDGTTEQKRFKGGFKVTYAKEFDELDARLMIPHDVKAKLVTKFLKAKRKQRSRDYDAYLASIEDWKKNSRQEAKLEMARSVMEGKHVVLEEVEARIMAKKPAKKWRRMLMTPEELAKLHAEGEKAWQDESAFQDEVFGALAKLGRETSIKPGRGSLK
jgi:hypothetical protein